MQHPFRIIAAAALLFGLPGPTSAVVDQSATARVEAVIARSASTRSTYAAYYWNRIQHPGQQVVEEWSAEFNSDNLHRVETPRDRVVADCAAGTGTYLSLVTGEVITGPQVASTACGINRNRRFLAMESLGRVRTRFGDADRVRLTDADDVRTYDVSDDGIILGTVYQANAPGRRIELVVRTVELSRSLPAAGMFDQPSLKVSFVPERFKLAPKPRR